MVKIKICGITDKDEVDFLNKLKPDYAGFVFAESKRKVNKEQAVRLCSILSCSIKTVGVFRNQTISEITDVLNDVNLNVIQLHGNEDVNYIKELRNKANKSIEIWKAVSIDNIEIIQEFYYEVYEYKGNKNELIKEKLINKYLIDGSDPGSGKEYSLHKLENMSNKIEFFLAGGVTPDNIKEKINIVHPFGVDVSSGVEYINEQGLRKKSYDKIKLLIGNSKINRF